jgi:hypothetical protein
MKQLKLSAAERKGIQIDKQIGQESVEDEWQAVGKAMIDRPISIEEIQRTLGWIWCGDRGMIVKEAGENKFLFAFHHPSAKKRAIVDGPWMVGHYLMVMVLMEEGPVVGAKRGSVSVEEQSGLVTKKQKNLVLCSGENGEKGDVEESAKNSIVGLWK